MWDTETSELKAKPNIRLKQPCLYFLLTYHIQISLKIQHIQQEFNTSAHQMVRGGGCLQFESKIAQCSFISWLQCQRLILYSKPSLLILDPGDCDTSDQLYGFLVGVCQMRSCFPQPPKTLVSGPCSRALPLIWQQGGNRDTSVPLKDIALMYNE